MSILTHTLGFPRIGLHRELKLALEGYWAGRLSQDDLLATGRRLRQQHWNWQQEAGIDLLPVGDFAWYDQVLTTSLMVGNVPVRHRNADGQVDLDTLFRIARGRAPSGQPARITSYNVCYTKLLRFRSWLHARTCGTLCP